MNSIYQSNGHDHELKASNISTIKNNLYHNYTIHHTTTTATTTSSKTTSSTNTRTNSTDCFLSSVEGRAANALSRRYCHQQVEFRDETCWREWLYHYSIPDDPIHISRKSEAQDQNQNLDQSQSSIFNTQSSSSNTPVILRCPPPQALTHLLTNSETYTSSMLKAPKVAHLMAAKMAQGILASELVLLNQVSLQKSADNKQTHGIETLRVHKFVRKSESIVSS